MALTLGETWFFIFVGFKFGTNSCSAGSFLCASYFYAGALSGLNNSWILQRRWYGVIGDFVSLFSLKNVENKTEKSKYNVFT